MGVFDKTRESPSAVNSCIACLPQNVYRTDLEMPENGGLYCWYIRKDRRSLSE